MATKIATVYIEKDYLKKLLKEGGNVWSTVWYKGKPFRGYEVQGAYGLTFGKFTKGSDGKERLPVHVIVNVGAPKKKSAPEKEQKVDEELL